MSCASASSFNAGADGAIRYSRTDTEETRRQIMEHNAAWDALCKK
jgi:hypothetical protein